MKAFTIIRADKPTVMVELTFKDLFKLLFGREIMIMVSRTENIILRHKLFYEMFNLRADIFDNKK